MIRKVKYERSVGTDAMTVEEIRKAVANATRVFNVRVTWKGEIRSLEIEEETGT